MGWVLTILYYFINYGDYSYSTVVVAVLEIS
jgi:hypothetical protein